MFIFLLLSIYHIKIIFVIYLFSYKIIILKS